MDATEWRVPSHCVGSDRHFSASRIHENQRVRRRARKNAIREVCFERCVMLQLPTRKSFEEPVVAPVGGRDENEVFDLQYIFAAIRRQWKIILGLTAIGAALGILYAVTSVPLYTTTTSIMIDRRQVRAVQDVSAVTDVGVDAPIVVDSQVEVLKSGRIALATINQLNLANDPTFWSREGWLLTSVYRRIEQIASDVAGKLRDRPEAVADGSRAREMRLWAAVYRLLSRTTIARVGKTYVITVSYTGTSPDQVVRIANAYVEAYLADQLDAKYEATRQANSWLQKRLDELRQQSVESDLAVQRFRLANNLIAVGGQLVSDLQLAELNTQLSVARGEVARTGARLDRIRTILDTNQIEALVGEAMGNAVISELQARYLEALRREVEIIASFGPDHERAVRYRSEKAEVKRQILVELSRVANGYESEYQIARSRQESLSQSVEKLIGVAAEANNSLVQLRELERAADTYKSLYQSFLGRYQQTVQQQSFPMSDARVVTPAVLPMQPSHPQTFSIILLSALMGTIVGSAYGAIREYRDGSLRTGDEVREELGLKCLGMLPTISLPRFSKWTRRNSLRGISPKDRMPLARYVLHAPHSDFAEALRSVATSASHGCGGTRARVIGVLSVAPQEGRTLIAANLAALLADEGSQTLLVDADFRNPTLTRILAPDATDGLLEVLADIQPWRGTLRRVPGSELVILPTVYREDLAHSSRLITSERFEEVLREASERFEYIIVDLPPLGAANHARALASKVDSVLLAVRWGHTSKALVKEALVADDLDETRCMGVVLNRVDMRLLRLYQRYPVRRDISDADGWRA
ncbi:Wzz/FepE/Etk N-terminal domain-containing protein [Microvirga brassicacearum]|uniref:Wzz/FepE/Etk N-terminal domain-containing protein n=1 Tax=Microvirga brassicacearum TaxID=2580413 RepID=UPI001390E161|nr:Wzz/FepE/Etk N-terminal domain-containing protein [Microvirga brassicacearum]